MSKTIGPYRLNLRGDYNPAADPLYSLLDLVSDGGGSFVYINDTPSNEPTSSASHWQQIASIGGQDLVDAAVAARDAAQAHAALAQGYAAQLAAGLLRPKGTYANLTALNAGTPTVADTNEIYITLDDGKWCYHNGSAWVAGGQFQAASVAADFAHMGAQSLLYEKNKFPIALEWEQGNIDANGADEANDYLVRTGFVNIANNTIYLESDGTLGLNAFIYSQADVFERAVGSKTAPYEFSVKNKKIRFAAIKIPTALVTPLTVGNVPIYKSSDVAGSVVDDFAEVDARLDDLEAVVGRATYQYIDNTAYSDGHFWGLDTGTHRVGYGDDVNYSAVKAENIKAGAYKLTGNYSTGLTIIENIATGYCALIAGFITSSDSEGDNFEVLFDFNLYLTIESYMDKDLFMFFDGVTPASYIYGRYGVDTSDSLLKNNTLIFCGATRTYTTLKAAIEEATKYYDATVYVDDGTYDLVTEFGTAYLDAYNGTDNIGIVLKNRVRVVFSGGAKIVFDYQGTNGKVHEYFSPFNAGPHGFTLENAWVESKNCRYSVHDERAHDADSYHNIYKRCTFIHDSSTASGWHAAQAIGGGLGRHGDIVIEDCYCTSQGNDDTISYHCPTISDVGDDSRSSLVIRGTYTSGTICLIELGSSEEITRALITGCNLRIEPKITSGPVDNIEIVKWGNTIRAT